MSSIEAGVMRFSLKTLLGAFALVGVTWAALIYPTRLHSALFFSSALLMLLLGLIAACARGGRARIYWTGFTVLGGGYFLCSMFEVHPLARASGERQTWSEPRLLTSELLLGVNDWLANVRPPSNRRASASTDSRISSQMYFVGRGSPGHTLTIGHSVFTLFFGLLGGEIASWIYLRNEGAGTDKT
jgi:hypothetical protein